MSRSSAPQVLERPGTERDTASLGAPIVDATRTAPAAVSTAGPTATAAEPVTAEPVTAEPATRPRTRRLPHPPGRRAHLWLAALIAGAVLAAVPGLTGPSDELTGTASDYGLGVAADLALSGGIDDAGVRRSISEAEAQARLGELAASRAARAPKTVLPTQGRLTTCYCMRWGQMHYGLDLAAPLGTPIYSAADGVVIKAGRVSGFGNAVYIQDADGNVHIYGHMRYYDVRAGDIVHAGDQIAKVGNEGYSTGPHLHYEIHRGDIDGRPLDPQDWLAERGVQI
ncbi:peptidase M23-like protein [Blastococcus colisei]|uniref:Peptidase M23-like protein n=1 Tax=Blastococcus colisei TaxID=1564162 RepID=A0A543PBH9_9ACTN|nr:M23 family metallopeptidase [Blastococcus colisei]TQN41425.1 peptidase M23-like protein [Blastococcus colisei]